MAKILITGGAGYIGSHAVFKMASEGYDVVVLDNLHRGYKQAIDTLQERFPGKISFHKADLTSKEEVEKVFAQEKDIVGVMHFAALCSVNESVENPYAYFRNNVYGTANLLETMRENDVKNIVFSSTCATYKVVGDGKVDENAEVAPDSPYGESKYLAEKEIMWYEKAFGFNAIRFRYFNVCGANEEGLIGDSKKPSQLLMQNAVRGALGIEEFKFTYGEVPTSDGSPVRDYINVEDLVDAHYVAMKKLLDGEKDLSGLYNIGTGNGNSVKEIVDKVKEVTGKEFPTNKGEARKGEAVSLYADTTKTREKLGWQAHRNLEQSINSLVKWYDKHPHGWDN
jgi:UDP-glucose 4-epimerase